MTTAEYQIKYPEMTETKAAMLAELDTKIVITLPSDYSEANIKLCRIDEPDCESCQ